MIIFKEIEDSHPYQKFITVYDNAKLNNQKNINAAAISSYNIDLSEVDSRFVNIKYITGNKWTFYTNLESPKAIQFRSHNQISVLFFRR